MKSTILLTTLVSLGLALTGCSRKEAREHAKAESESHEHGGVTFSAKQGLSVRETTAKFIGLQVADVEERNVTASIRFNAQVFQSLSERKFASVTANATSVALATAFVAANQATLLTNGQSATVSLTNGEPLKATIADVNHALEKVQGQTEVMVSIHDPEARLKNGQIVPISVPLGREQSVATIPRSALLRTAEGEFVYTVSGKHFVRAKIKTGEVGADFVEIADGLYAGDRVVVQPVMTLWLAELQSIRGGKACADD